MPYRAASARRRSSSRAEVRDVLAWLRLLVDPSDAGAVVRALARPPVELRSVDLARCMQIARRRKLDMVSGARRRDRVAAAAARGARARSSRFLKLHRAGRRARSTRAPRPLRAPPDRAPRPAPPAALRRAGRRRRAAASTSRGSASSRPPTCAARRRPRRASSRATSPRSPRPGCATTRHAGATPARRRRRGAADATPPRACEFDHVFVSACSRARMPGARRARVEPIPDALLHEALPPTTREAHVAEMRRLLHVAMTRARDGLVLAYAARSERGAPQHAVAVRRGGARRARRGVGGPSRRSCSAPTRRCTRRSRRCATSCSATSARSARGLGELRLDTDLDVTHAVARYLELAQARGAAGAARRASRSPTRCPASTQRPARGGDAAAARGARRPRRSTTLLLDAERDDRARAAARGRARRAVAGGVPAAPRRGPRAVGARTSRPTGPAR